MIGDPVRIGAALVLAAGMAGQDPAARGRELLGRLAERTAETRTLSGRFVQRVRTPLLAKPLVTRGTFAFRREPPCLVFAITEPRRARCRFDEHGYLVYRPGEGTAERWRFADDELGGIIVRVLAPRPEELEGEFDITGCEVEKGLATVRLRPKKKDVRGHVRELALEIAVEDAELRGLAYTNADGDRVHIALEKTKRNAEIPPERFRDSVPDGTRVQVHELER